MTYVLSTMEDNSNVTIRDRRRFMMTGSLSMESTDSLEDAPSSINARSMIDLSTHTMTSHQEVITSLQLSIENLKKQLQTTRSENTVLKQKLDEQIHINKQLNKQINGTTVSSPKKKNNNNKTEIRAMKPNIEARKLDLDLEFQTPKSSPLVPKDTKVNLSLSQCDDELLESSHIDRNKPTLKPSGSRRLLIFGTQQCVGLAAKLLKTRLYTNYEKYRITAVTKPFASSEEVFKCCENLNLNKDDKLVIGVGENDTNPFKLLIELSATLKRLYEVTVIVLRINYNKSLNVSMLNNNVKLVCNNFPNCYFIDYFGSSYNKNKYIICQKINYIIDSIDYDTKYLSLKNNKNSTLHTIEIKNDTLGNLTKNNSRYTQRTILDYFKKINIQTPNCTSIQALPTNNNLFFRK